MAKQKSIFNSILYEKEDIVLSIYSKDPRNIGTYREIEQTILDTKIVQLGNIETQMILFDEQYGWEVSNHYRPFGNTIEKYKDGLIMMNKTTTIIKSKVDKIEEEIKEVVTFRLKLPNRKVIENN